MIAGVQRDGAVLERHRHLAPAPATDDGAEPREELVEGKRLHEVVVGTEVEAVDPVRDLVPGRDHQDGRVEALRTQALAHGEPVEAGKHEVEKDDVVLVRQGPRLRGDAVLDEVDEVLLLVQPLDEEAADGRVVFDEQDTHGCPQGLRASIIS